MKFVVKWAVEHFDADVTQYCDMHMDEEGVNDLDAIFDFLDEGIENDSFSPELEVEHHDGDFNIEYVLIADENSKEIWRDEDYEGE